MVIVIFEYIVDKKPFDKWLVVKFTVTLINKIIAGGGIILCSDLCDPGGDGSILGLNLCYQLHQNY